MKDIGNNATKITTSEKAATTKYLMTKSFKNTNDAMRFSMNA